MSRSSEGGGAADRPEVVTGGPPPVDPDDAASVLPEGFVLPEGWALVHSPPPTLEQTADGAREHATMEAGVYAAARARAVVIREHAAGLIDGAAASVAEARGNAMAAHDRACQAEIAAGREPAPWAEPGEDDGNEAGEG